MGRYDARTVPAFRCGDEALLPVRQLADLAEIATRPLPGGGIELLLQPQDRRITLDPSLTGGEGRTQCRHDRRR